MDLRSTSGICCGVLAAVALIASGCNSEAGSANPQKGAESTPAIHVTVASSRLQPVERTIEVVGTLYGDEETLISAKVAGRIIAIFHDVGDRVALGDELLQLDRTDYELNVVQKRMAIQEALAKLGLSDFPEEGFDPSQVPTVVRAQRQAANAEARLNRARQLFEQKQPLISEQDYADLQTAYEVARSDYEVALLNAQSLLAEAKTRRSELALEMQRLRDTTVKAPEQAMAVASSTTTTVETNNVSTADPDEPRYAVTARMVSVGEYVREGTPLFRLVADNPIKFRASVPERFSARVKVGQMVRIRVDAYDQPFVGRVARINPAIDPLSRTFQIEVLIENSHGLLRPGAFARGSVYTHVDENVTFVPRDAIVTFAGVKKLYAIENGKAIEVNVQTGVTLDGYVEITEGFSGVREVAVTGTNALANDVAVQVVGRMDASSQHALPAATEASNTESNRHG